MESAKKNTSSADFHPDTGTSSETVPVPPPYRDGTGKEMALLKTVSLSDLLSTPDLHVRWAVESLIPEESVAILAGPAGSGKTWLLLDLAIEVASGGKWLGNFKCMKGTVLYIDEESSKPLLRKRLSKLLKHKIPQNDQIGIDFCVGESISLSDVSSLGQLRQLIQIKRPSLIVVDSLIRVHRADENSSVAMAQIFGEVKKIVREFKCSFIFADHQRKPGQFRVNEDVLLRGTTEKVAFTDSLMSIAKKNTEGTFTHSKSRFTQEIPSFAFELVDTDSGGIRVSYMGAQKDIDKSRRVELAKGFLEKQLSECEEWVRRRELIECAKEDKISRNSVDEALSDLFGDGIVLREKQRVVDGKGGKEDMYRWNNET